jgi:hypothetical protein
MMGLHDCPELSTEYWLQSGRCRSRSTSLANDLDLIYQNGSCPVMICQRMVSGCTRTRKKREHASSPTIAKAYTSLFFVVSDMSFISSLSVTLLSKRQTFSKSSGAVYRSDHASCVVVNPFSPIILAQPKSFNKGRPLFEIRIFAL